MASTVRVASSSRPKPPPEPSMKSRTGSRGESPRPSRACARSEGWTNSSPTGMPVTVTRSRATPRAVRSRAISSAGTQ